MPRNRFGEPEVLDSMAWIAMDFDARVQLAANKFIRNEKKIERNYKRYDGPTAGNVKAFVSSLFTIPRGQGKATVEGVLQAIGPQRAVREKRSKLRPFKFKPPTDRTRTKRLNAIGHRFFTIWYDERKLSKASYRIVGITQMNGLTIVVDKGDYGTKPRVYLRQRETGRVKVVVLEKTGIKSITDALLRLAPKTAYRGMFNGVPLLLDFDGEGFLVGGKLHKWRNVRRIYRGLRAAHSTVRDPEK